MAFQPVTDGALVVVQFSGPGEEPWVCTMGARLTIDMSQAVADAFGDAIYGGWNAHMKDRMSDSVQFVKVTTTDLREEGAPEYFKSFTTSGTESGNILPYQVAGLISITTEFRGRSGRGRIYWPAFTETYSDGHTMATGTQTKFQDMANDWLAAGYFGVISRFHGVDPDTHEPIPRESGIINDWTGVTAHAVWASQRGRQKTP